MAQLCLVYHITPYRGVACLKFNVCDCGDEVYAFMQMIPNREHLQIAQTQMRRRRLISVCAICQVEHILGNGGQC